MATALSLSLFFLSFTPLWLSIAFIDMKSILGDEANDLTEKISLVVMYFCICGSLFVASKFLERNERGALSYKIESVSEQKAITTEYLLAYILPLASFNFTRWNEVAIFIIYFVMLAYLCVKHNQFSINIVLEFCGYSFYKCMLKSEDGVEISKIIISKNRLINYKGCDVFVKSLNNEYSVDTKLIENLIDEGEF